MSIDNPSIASNKFVIWCTMNDSRIVEGNFHERIPSDLTRDVFSIVIITLPNCPML